MNYGTGHALGTKTTTYEYDAAGNRTKVTYPHGWVALDYSYDALNRLNTITNASTGTPYASYAYDALSRRSSLTRSNGKVTSYSYHEDSMPATMTHAGLATGGGALTWDFAFDKANQMTGRTVSDDFFQWKPEYNNVEDYSRNGLNQYTTVSANPFKYDGNGSLTDTHDGTVDDGWAYAYDVVHEA